MKNQFTTREVNSLTLGEKLKEAREKVNFSLEEISEKTRIQAKYIQRLEEGQYDQLPADVYVRGFLKDYLPCLGLDCRKTIRIYSRERRAVENLKQKESRNLCSSPFISSDRSQSPTKSRIKRFCSSLIITPRSITLAFITLAIVSALIYFSYQVSSFIKTPQLVLTQPAADLTVKGKNIIFSGQTEKDVSLIINGETIYLDQEGKFSETISLQEGLNTIEVKATNRFEKTATIVRQIISQ